jgi:hypothetical protein
MYRLSAAIAAACLALAAPVSAQGPVLPLAAPPAASSPTASSIFDAMIAISRASTSNPRAAQTASFSYAAAIQEYNAGDFDRARASAVQAIGQTDAPFVPQPQGPTGGPAVPAPTVQMPPNTSVRQSDMEVQLALARHALMNCGDPDGAAYLAENVVYGRVVTAELANNPRLVRSDVQSIVDACAPAVSKPAGSAP